MSSALIAAGEVFGSLPAAAEKMIRYEKTVEPDASLSARYEEIYGREAERISKEKLAQH